MRYISGIHALNLPCSLETCGDWHTSALHWDNIDSKLVDSEDSAFGDWGIEICDCVPENPGTYYIANTIRALLDMLYKGNFELAQGMKEDFICNDKYNSLVFEKVLILKNNNNWSEIDKFIEKEYKMQWINYKEEKRIV